MCMKGTSEACILLERMTKVETRQNIILVVVLLMFATLGFMAIKMLNAQIYMLTGNDGLRTISVETRQDVKAIGSEAQTISGECPEARGPTYVQ